MAAIRGLPVALAVAAPGAPALAASADMYDCRRDETVRRIEVQVADRPSRLPCEVVYTKGGTSSVLWEANNQLDFCMDRARELAARLEEAGWSCTLEGAEPAREDGAPETPLREEPAPEDAAPEVAPSEETAESRLSAVEDIAPAAGRPERAALEDALDRDLDRLSSLTPSGDFRVEEVSLGDIDENGFDDAAVLMTFGRDEALRDPYLVAYLFDGATFRATAQVRVGQDVADLESAELQGIERGGIDVLLSIREPDDPACCPSGRRLVSFELRDGALIEQSGRDSGA